MPPIIETSNLRKIFPLPKRYKDLILHPFLKKETIALEDINILIDGGEIFGLLGPNGSGKTTLIKILSTLILPTSGKAFINGLDVTSHEEKIKKMIGYVVSDERSFFWRLTGRQNLRFFASLNNIPPSKIDSTIQELIRLIGLEKEIDNVFQNYSSGNKQKMAIIRGLLTNPRILFLDEPTRSLDPVVTHNLRSFIKEVLVEQTGKTVLIATNNMQEAEDLCSRVAIIQNGKIKKCDTIKEIKNIFVGKKRYVLMLKSSLEEIQARVDHSYLKNKVVNLGHGVSENKFIFLTVEIDMKNESISEIIEWLVTTGIKIESCIHQELPLSEIFKRCINA
ncbi:MAG: ABC transporter ATP-binding protein [Deltaproteobacteria bacterium]|nr:ABC transporter ATP-binding protein [Deltaproteobacteria bacterium]